MLPDAQTKQSAAVVIVFVVFETTLPVVVAVRVVEVGDPVRVVVVTVVVFWVVTVVVVSVTVIEIEEDWYSFVKLDKEVVPADEESVEPVHSACGC